jgi:tRNA(Ile)-lysidine synthase
MTFQVSHLLVHLDKFNNANHLYVGYSGGLDSHVLLYALTEFVDIKKITAIHINHKLSRNSDMWQKHCEDTCFALGINIICKTIYIKNKGAGVENAARDARYSIFEKLLNKGDLLVLAHHADDQVETMLYRLLRGSGTKGACGMPISRPLGLGMLFRPMLPFFQIDIKSYAQIQGISWIEDESNKDITFDRNYIRHKVVPIINDRWPNFSVQLNRSGKIFAESDHLMSMLAAQDFENIKEIQEKVGWSIPINKLSNFEKIRQKNILRYWIAKHNLVLPSYAVLENGLNQLMNSRADAQPIVSWCKIQLRRFKKKLYLLPIDFNDINYWAVKKKGGALAAKKNLKWNGKSKINLPDGSTLSIISKTNVGIKIDENKLIEIRFRDGGERCKPKGRESSNTLKKLFQEYELEPWLRNNIPLIYIDNSLAAVGDLWVCDDFSFEIDGVDVQLKWGYT